MEKKDDFIFIFFMFIQLMLIILATTLGGTSDKKDESLSETIQRLENKNIKIEIEEKNKKE